MAEQQFTDFDIDVNLSDVDAWGGDSRPVVKPGDYKLRITNAESKNAKTSNNPMVAITAEVVEAFDEANADEVGKPVYQNYVLTPNAMGRIKSLMVACGAPLDKISGRALLGAVFIGTVYHEDSSGSVDENGNPRPPRTFANIKNERMIEGEPAPAQTQTKTPPIQRGAATTKAAPATTKPANGTPRRA